MDDPSTALREREALVGETEVGQGKAETSFAKYYSGIFRWVIH